VAVGHARKPARALDGEREWGSEVVVATGRGLVKMVHVTEPAFSPLPLFKADFVA
jgi:hypothetical protein